MQDKKQLLVKKLKEKFIIDLSFFICCKSFMRLYTVLDII